MRTPQAIFFNARAVIRKVENGKSMVLVQRRTRVGEANTYEFPGGCVELGESVLDALKREVMEETGLTVTKIHGVENYSQQNDIETVQPFSVYYKMNYWMHPAPVGSYKSVGVHFKCEAEGELLEKGDDTDSIQWVTAETLQAILAEPGSFSEIDRGAAELICRELELV